MPWFKRGGIWIARDIDTAKLLGKARNSWFAEPGTIVEESPDPEIDYEIR